VTELDENGNLITDGERVPRRDPLSYFSKNASIMHGRFGTHDVPHQADVLASEDVRFDEKVDPDFDADLQRLFDFDPRS
jgi:hypothetical protein